MYKIFVVAFILNLTLFPPLTHAETTTLLHRNESAQMLFEEGLRLRELGELNKAEWHIKRALEVMPGNAAYRFELANIYAIQYDRLGKKRVRDANRQMLEYAARELEQATMIQPGFIAAHFNLGVVRKKQGEYEQAREKFKHVLEYDPNIVNAYLQIAATYEDQGFYDEAKDVYMRAKEMDYGNREIDHSIEDLRALKERDYERRLQQDYRRSYSRYGGFEYAPGSHASFLRGQHLNEIENGQSIVSAVPYLTLWLVDQFMQLKDRE